MLVLRRHSALVALIVAGLLWGLTVPLSKLVLDWLPGGWLTLIRFAIAAPLLALAWMTLGGALAHAGWLDLPGSAYLPDAYVGDSGAKLEMYRRFATSRSDADAEQLRGELRGLRVAWCPDVGGLPIEPEVAAVLDDARARLEACGLAGKRALALRRAARVDLGAPDWRARLLAIPEIGTWTVEIVALHGFGELDQVPAADLGYLKLVCRLLTGHPQAVADEAEVRGFFAAYAGWAGLAGVRRFGGGTFLEAGWVQLGTEAPLAVPIADLERFS